MPPCLTTPGRKVARQRAWPQQAQRWPWMARRCIPGVDACSAGARQRAVSAVDHEDSRPALEDALLDDALAEQVPAHPAWVVAKRQGEHIGEAIGSHHL